MERSAYLRVVESMEASEDTRMLVECTRASLEALAATMPASDEIRGAVIALAAVLSLRLAESERPPVLSTAG
jgi:hypothetical protein